MVSPLVKLCQLEGEVDFPPHIISILSPDKVMPCTEILCRLLHVCMIEVGFIPVHGNNLNDDDINTHYNATMEESIPKLVESLKGVLDKNGNLHNVNYRAIVVENSYEDVIASGVSVEEEEYPPTAGDSLVSCSSIEIETTGSIPVTSKDSGDSTSLTAIEMTNGETTMYAGKTVETSPVHEIETVPEKVFSENIIVSVIHDGLSLFVVANTSRHSKNIQLYLPQYMHPTSPGRFPLTATFPEYKAQMYFSAVRFADDVKHNLCYPMMDAIDGISFEIRSLDYLPAEMIVEIANRCSPVAVFRLRATSAHLHNVLGDDNQQFWKMMLTRDFPNCNPESDRMKGDSSKDKYFKKYIEMCNFTFRPRFRRLPNRMYPFPFYFLNNF